MRVTEPQTLKEEFDAIVSPDSVNNNTEQDVRIDFGIPSLEGIIEKPYAGCLVALGARPSEGKSALALQMALNSALKHNSDVLYFSLEMPSVHIVRRLLKTQLGNIQSNLDDADLNDKLKVLFHSSLYVDTCPSIGIEELRTEIREFCLKRESLKTVVFIDYLQLIRGPKDFLGNREEEISYIIRELKASALENNIPIIILSQLSRSAITRNPGELSLHDLRESGSLEDDSDVVILFSKHRGIIAKNRLGKVGEFKWAFDEEYLTFKPKEDLENKI